MGIGASVNQYELNSIATDRNHAFTVGSFDILHTLQEEIKEESCGGKFKLDVRRSSMYMYMHLIRDNKIQKKVIKTLSFYIIFFLLSSI